MSDSMLPVDAKPAAETAETMPPTPIDGFQRPTTGRAADTIPKNFGRYRLSVCLGRGGMGAVFKAHDSQLDRVVALKVPFLGDDTDDTRQRFYREARAAANLHHANICPVFDVGEFAGMPYLTMAFIEGRSLAQARADNQTFSWVQIAVLMRKLAQAMQVAHARGVIHRDLKPANVLLGANNEPTIMDFGLARKTDDKKSHGLTQQGDILGTVDYMSPEQVMGNNEEVGPASDIYALGTMLYELLTGRRPFDGSTTAILAQIPYKDAPKPRELKPEIPAKLEEICLKAIAKKPEDRFASMQQFAAALFDYLRTYQQNANTTVMKAPDSTPKGEAPTAKMMPAKENTAVLPPPQPKSAPRSTEPRSSKRTRSSRRRKAKPKQASMLPLIFGIGAGVIVIGGMIAAAIAFWPSADKSSAQATAPASTIPSPPPQGSKGPPGPPRSPNSGPPTSPQAPAKPRPGVALRLEPAEVTLAVGQQQKVTLKIERQDYQGPITLNWTAPKDVRISPNGPVTLQPNQTEFALNLRTLLEPADPKLRFDITATATNDPGRSSSTANVTVQIASGPCIRVVEIGDKPAAIESMAFSSEGTIALIGGGAGRPAGGGPGNPGGPSPPPGGQTEEKNAIQVWNLDRAEATASLAGHSDKVIGLCLSADEKIGLSVSLDETVSIWDMALGKRKQQFPKVGTRVLTASMSSDHKRGLFAYAGTAASHGFVVKVNLDTFQAMHAPIDTAILVGSRVEDAVRTTAVSSDHKLGLIGAVNGKLVLIDMLKPDAKPKSLVGHNEAVQCAVFSPAGGFAATGGGGTLLAGSIQPGKDNAVRMWDTAKAMLAWTGEGHTASVMCLAFSSDGKWLASGGSDGEVRVWDTADGKSVATFPGHTGRVFGLAFSADGKKLWSGAADRTLRQWRLP